MSKTLTTIGLLFLTSVGLVWYSAKIKKEKPEKRSLLVGLNAQYPPFAFKEHGQPIGFDIDMITEISKRLNEHIEFKDMSFPELITELEDGTVDLIISGISPLPQRTQHILFTQPYLTGDSLVIVSLADSPIKSVNDLIDKPVVVNEGFNADFYLSKHKGSNIVRTETIEEAFLELLGGRAAAFVSAQAPLKPFLNLHPQETFTIVSIPESEDNYAIGVSKKQAKLLEKIQKILNTMQEDGSLELLKQKWGLLPVD